MEDFLYKNAPLIEVLAEIHWELIPVSSIPGGQLDPYAPVLREKFGAWARREGFHFQEQLVPSEMPSELMPHKPFQRFRRQANEWPLYQIGPGIFTANIVPPYLGWSAFRDHLRNGLQSLYASYPSSGELLRIKRWELQYIDAFTSSLRMHNYSDFIQAELSVRQPLPCSFTTQHCEQLVTTFESTFECKNEVAHNGVIKLGPGKLSDQDAAVLQLSVRSRSPEGNVDVDRTLQWFDKAHLILRSWFKELPSEALKQAMGPEVPLEFLKG